MIRFKTYWQLVLERRARKQRETAAWEALQISRKLYPWRRTGIRLQEGYHGTRVKRYEPIIGEYLWKLKRELAS